MCTDLRDKQTQRLLRIFDVNELLSSAVDKVLSLLYPDGKAEGSKREPPWPATRSITLHFDSNEGGVAVTGGLPIDDDHKEMKLSTGYDAQKSDADYKYEITGV